MTHDWTELGLLDCQSVHQLASIIQSNPPYRQNAELARVRQECVRLGCESMERSNALRANEEHGKSLEAKMATAEQELARIKVRDSQLLS